MKSYTVEKSEAAAKWLCVDEYPWGCEYRPAVSARVYAAENGLHVTMRCVETNPRAEVTTRNGSVCTDSCLEFFFCPMPESGLMYFNFEVNSSGVMYIGFSQDGTRAGSSPLDAPENSYFGMAATVAGEYWQVDYTVPYEFIKQYMPDFNFTACKKMTANFYNCGDLTDTPHYAVWNPVGTASPDYHVPEYFGELNFA